MKILKIALCAAAALVGVAHAEDAATLSNNIDTWIQGTVLSVDADGQKFSVRGVKLPYATAEAGMMQDIAEKTKGLDATQREAKIAEIRQSWADKLSKAQSEKVADSASDFNFSLPDKASLVIMAEKSSNPAESPNQKVSASSSSSASASVSSDGTIQKSAEATAVTDPKLAAGSTQKELQALKTLKDLKVGDSVKVGFDGGLLSNTAYVVLEGGAVVR